jgi:hypothetical protein
LGFVKPIQSICYPVQETPIPTIFWKFFTGTSLKPPSLTKALLAEWKKHRKGQEEITGQ